MGKVKHLGEKFHKIQGFALFYEESPTYLNKSSNNCPNQCTGGVKGNPYEKG